MAQANKTWTMPQPNIGDCVLFSKDYRDFSKPTVGWVMQEPGHKTISIVTFTPSGYSLVFNSCHHKDDPALSEDNGWQDLGVWEFAPSTQTMRELTQKSEVTSAGKSSSKQSA